MAGSEYNPELIHAMDQGGEALVQFSRHAARAYIGCVGEGMPPAQALYLVCDMMRAALGVAAADGGEDVGS